MADSRVRGEESAAAQGTERRYGAENTGTPRAPGDVQVGGAVVTRRGLAALVAVGRVLHEARRPQGVGVGERLRAAPRMAWAALTGRYRHLDRGRLVLFALAVAYVVSPVDLMPEAALWFVGTVDDIGVAAWLTGALLVETDRFLAWEAVGRPGDHLVVPGEVVGRGS